jgi:CRISPR-associated protein Cas1
MTSLYVDRRGVELRLDGDALAFYENGERCGTVPLAPLDRVYLRGDVTLQSSLLGKLGAHGIGVIVVSGRKGEASLMMAQPHNDAARRIAQYRLSQDAGFCLAFAQCVVELKLREQADFLLALREKDLQARYELTSRGRQVREALDKIAQQTSIAALRGLEGHAAAAYFAGLAAHMPATLGFDGRNRRPPRDPLNVVLSLGYTLLHADTVLALYGAGLDPHIGFYHALNFGRESLACDVMEPLRPWLDRFAVQLFKSGELRPEDFSSTAQGCLMGKAGRARFYPQYEAAAENFRKRLTDSIGDLVSALKTHGLPDQPQRRSAAAADDFDDVWSADDT